MTRLTEPTQTERTVAIVCDRCETRLDAGTPEFDAATQIEHRCGYRSVWEDGEEVRADLCEPCLKQLIDGFAQKKGADAQPEERRPGRFKGQIDLKPD